MNDPNPRLESKSHPYLARIVAKRLQADSAVSVIHNGEKLWRFDGRVWRQLHETEVSQAIMELEHAKVCSGTDEQGQTKIRPLTMTAGTLFSIESVLYRLKDIARPRFFEPAPFGLQFNNGFITVNNAGQLRFEPCSPDHRQRVLMDWDWQPDAKAPRFEEALEQWFRPSSESEDQEADYDRLEDARDKVRFLQEFCGASLVGMATRFAKAAILYGQGSNGKSVFIDAIRHVFPNDACSSIEPQTMSQEYRAAQLAGRRINFAADIPSHEIVSSSTFKAVVSGDIITARHIRQDPFEFRPQAGHLFSANELPGTRDHSDGFWRRFVVVEFANSFKKSDRDSLLTPKLCEERAGIVVWMLKGAARLLKQGHYTIPPSSDHICTAWRKDADVVALWLEECTTTADTTAERTAGRQLWNSFDRWRQDNRYSAMGSRTFYRRLQNLIGKPHKTKSSNAYDLQLIR